MCYYDDCGRCSTNSVGVSRIPKCLETLGPCPLWIGGVADPRNMDLRPPHTYVTMPNSAFCISPFKVIRKGHRNWRIDRVPKTSH